MRHCDLKDMSTGDGVKSIVDCRTGIQWEGDFGIMLVMVEVGNSPRWL